MATSLPEFPSFDAENPENIAIRWQRWFMRFENLLIALDIKDKKRKRALLLHYIGESTLNIFETLPETGEADDYDKACEALNEHFKPRKNTSFEIFKFRKTTQNVDETLDQYHVRLIQKAKYCEFSNLDAEIKAQIELGTNSKQLRRYAFRKPKLTLAALLDYGRTLETVENNATGIERHMNEISVKDINAVKRGPAPTKPGKQSQRTCFYCGLTWPHENDCPAKGKTCNYCHKQNHFARCCKSRSSGGQGKYRPSLKSNERSRRLQPQVKQIDEQGTNSSSDEYVYTVHTQTHRTNKIILPSVSTTLPSKETVNDVNSTCHKRDFHTHIKINDITVRVNIDSGASVNIIDKNNFAKLTRQKNIQLIKSKIKLFAFATKTPLDIKGYFEATVESGTKITTARFYVINTDAECLISGNTAIDLGLLKLNKVSSFTSPPENSQPQKTATTATKSRPKRLRALFSKYDHLFQGIGKVPDYKVHLHIDKTVQPTIQKARRIPFTMRTKLSNELRRLESLDIIESVKGPTSWVSPIVCFPKPNNPDQIRLCVDMRIPNKAILRERHPSPTTDDLIEKLNGAAYFSKLDLSSGYHQLELDEASRDITTFATHEGLKRYKRLNFGTNNAAEIFQNVIQTTFQDIEGCINISDDILIFAKTQHEHDLTLESVLKRANDKNLRFNGEKCEFDKSSITFYGHVFSKDGVSPCPKKIEAIKSLKRPANVSELRSYLGMITYCGRFIKDLASLTAPLRKLTKKDMKFEWQESQQHAFDTLQDLLNEKTTLSYFDPSKDTKLIVDASPTGLAAILIQNTPNKNDETVVAYGSRALSDVEQRYSQTEREALAIVFGCEHFRLFLYGIHFTVYSDHKPLVSIFENPNSHCPARLERWRLRLQSYHFKIHYRPGHDNPSDYMSRHPLDNNSIESQDSENSEYYIQFIANVATPKAMNLQQIKDATHTDPTLQHATHVIQENAWHTLDTANFTKESAVDIRELKLLRNVKDELTVSKDKNLILRGTRIVIPKSLRAAAIRLAHVGHQGIVKTKSLLREKVWFPFIDSLVKTEIESCIPCQATGHPKPPQPLKMREIPKDNFDTVYMDFLGPLPTGETLFVLIDGRSRYPVTKIMKKTDASHLIPCLDEIFATFGLPKEVISDNGPPFKSNEIKKFMDENGIKHKTITPLWPQANESETFMKPLMKAIRTAHLQKQNWRRMLQEFLLNYRATPHTTTQVAPSTLMFGRNTRTKLPQVDTKMDKNAIDQQVEQRDKQQRQRMKQYADKRRQSKKTTTKIGDFVLVRQQKKNKFTPNFDPKPLRITKVKGTMITAERPGFKITRNQSFFKPIQTNALFSEDEEEIEVSDQEEERDDIGNNRDQQLIIERQYPRRERRRPNYYT